MATRKGDVPAVIRGMGVGGSIIATLVKKSLAAGLIEEDIHRLDKPEGEPVFDQMIAVMVEAWGLVRYAITADYSQSIEQMVAALRCDGYVNPEIKTANFGEEIKAKKSAKEDLEVVLLPFNREVTSQEVLDEMGKKGLRPATLAELLAFGAKHPDIQREFPIVGLGSSRVLSGRRRVACLWGGASGRGLCLDCFGSRWSAGYRFLAVSK